MIRLLVRKVVEIIAAIILFSLQITLFKRLEIASVSPNLLIIIVATVGLLSGSREGMFIGFVSGLFIDMYFSSYLGVYALIFLFIGYVIGLFKQILIPTDIKLPLFLILLADFMYNGFVYVFQYMFRGDFSFVYYLTNVVMPEMMYTIIVALFVYPIYLKISNSLDEYEKKGASKFG